ncbi:MAG: SUMF1/EgtB/PvdO family nonheme iron enzyme, partial [Rubripirellula sp.]|nr:SUMF1/EgtB/PvdO family nonheme iron enzyme [Rubripirellula sp.]
FVNWLNTSHGYSAAYKFSTSGATDNTAVFNEATATGPADVDQAGGLNAYGTMGLSGNVYEWEESSFDQTNSSPTLNRSRRGGSWATTNVNYLSSSLRQGLWQ